MTSGHVGPAQMGTKGVQNSCQFWQHAVRGSNPIRRHAGTCSADSSTNTRRVGVKFQVALANRAIPRTPTRVLAPHTPQCHHPASYSSCAVPQRFAHDVRGERTTLSKGPAGGQRCARGASGERHRTSGGASPDQAHAGDSNLRATPRHASLAGGRLSLVSLRAGFFRLWRRSSHSHPGS